MPRAHPAATSPAPLGAAPFGSQGGKSLLGSQGSAQGGGGADAPQVCSSSTSQPPSSPLGQLRGSPHHTPQQLPACAAAPSSEPALAWVVPPRSLPGGSSRPSPARSGAAGGSALPARSGGQSPPDGSLLFPGQWPMVKLKINISLTPSSARPSSCRELAAPPRCNPSTKTTLGPRRPGRCGTGGRERKEQPGPEFLIPAHPRHSQSTAKRQSFPGNCLPPALPPAPAEPPGPRDVPALACTAQRLQPRAGTPAPGPQCCCSRARRPAAAPRAEGTSASEVEPGVPALGAGPRPSPCRRKLRRRWRQGDSSRWGPCSPRIEPRAAEDAPPAPR